MNEPKKETDSMTPAALRALVEGDSGNFMAAMLPGGIEAQEAAGQRTLTAQPDRLPMIGTVANRGGSADDAKRKQWEAAGFVFGDPIKEPSQRDREVFVSCTFPPGWKLVPSDHSMWSHVVDDKGRKRAGVFFKAAFYDYNAHTFGLEPRYRVYADYGEYGTKDGEPYATFGVFDEDAKRMIHVTKVYQTREACYADSFGSPAEDGAARWLDECFPDHRNPLAYWDSPSTNTGVTG